jgi:tRNA pseudouridine55 synthase
VEEIFYSYTKITLKQEFDRLVHNGNPFLPGQAQEELLILPEEQVRVYDSENSFIGIYKFSSEKEAYTPVKMFL